MTPLHLAARAHAEAGIPVFPCEEDGKRPATAKGFKDATTELAQVDAWWTENPNYNLALCPDDAGWCVVDLDGDEGLRNWEAFKIEHDIPRTYVVRTPRGGQHVYFTGVLPPTASKIDNCIDTRGIGSYVLVPPSKVGGNIYRVIDDFDLAVLPACVAEAAKVKTGAAKVAVAELDLAPNISRAEGLLNGLVKRGDVAREGEGGDNRTYQLCCELLNLGLSVDRAQDLLLDLWNPHCEPPWSDEELRVKFSNAGNYAQNDAGAWAVAPAEQVFASALDKLAKTTPQERRSRFHPEGEDEQDLGTDPEWLIKDLIQERSTNLWVGQTQSYKSFLALDAVLGISAGVETFGHVAKPGPTFYAALEGKSNIKRARRRAWRLGREIEGKLENFYVLTAPMIGMEGEAQEFGEQIAKVCGKEPPRLIVLDTVSKCMAGLNENDAGDAGKFIRFCDSLVEEFGCAVIAIHHTGKDDGRGARGSSAFHAGFDSVVEIRAHRKTKAVEAWVRKHKDADERETPWTFEGKLLGPSLVFSPTSAEEHARLTSEEDEFAPTKIGAALRSLGAIGEENGVSTAALAQTVLTPIENESVEHRQSSLVSVAKKLGAMSRGKLRAYALQAASGIIWCLPPSV